MVKLSFRYSILAAEPTLGCYIAARRLVLLDAAKALGGETKVDTNPTNPMIQTVTISLLAAQAAQFMSMLMELGILGFLVTTDTQAEMVQVMTVIDTATRQGMLISQECLEQPQPPAPPEMEGVVDQIGGQPGEGSSLKVEDLEAGEDTDTNKVSDISSRRKPK